MPWSNIENKEDVGRRKLEIDHLQLVDGLGPEMRKLVGHLLTLDYRDKPNYDYIMDLFQKIILTTGHREASFYFLLYFSFSLIVCLMLLALLP